MPVDSCQLELPLHSRCKASRVDAAEVEQLVGFLRGRGWVTARRIGELAQGRGWNERKLRALAHLGRQRILAFPGSPGYRLLEEATTPEIDRGIKTFDRQIAEMTQRKLALTTYKHSLH